MQKFITEIAHSFGDIKFLKSEAIKFSEVNQYLEISQNIQLEQPDKGYRFSIDPILLVSNIIPKEKERILDIGTGCGIMPLLIAFKYPNIHITAVEIQKELANIAKKNIETNNLGNRITLINRDIREIDSFDTNNKFDRVISNPPYTKKGSGRINPDIQKAIARHEITLTLDELILSASRFLKHNGTLNLIYPTIRLTELFSSLRNNFIKPVTVKFIYTNYIDTNYIKNGKSNIENLKPKPKLVLLTCVNNLPTI